MRGKKNIGKDLFPSSLLIICVVVLTRGVPSEPLLVELDHGLGALHVGLSREHKVGLVRTLPLDEEHELARRVLQDSSDVKIQLISLRLIPLWIISMKTGTLTMTGGAS